MIDQTPVRGRMSDGWVHARLRTMFVRHRRRPWYVRDLMRDAADDYDRWSDEDIAAIETIAADHARGIWGDRLRMAHFVQDEIVWQPRRRP